MDQANNNNNKKIKENTTVNFNKNYRRQIKLLPINTEYCLLKFDVGIIPNARFKKETFFS